MHIKKLKMIEVWDLRSFAYTPVHLIESVRNYNLCMRMERDGDLQLRMI